jgi:hypothetical protein
MQSTYCLCFKTFLCHPSINAYVSHVLSSLYGSRLKYTRTGCCRKTWRKRRSKAVLLLGLRVRIPPGAWMPIFFECRKIEVYTTGQSVVQRSPTECGVWCVCVWSWNINNEETRAHQGCQAMKYTHTHTHTHTHQLLSTCQPVAVQHNVTQHILQHNR